ncbi:dye-decolorizing peroxidase YfeX [Aplysia californica]|uniref:Dye-decolorizing peroxidase YfeX n=1 Tax=Aplysia californica TaxID=6500 RepID=A0ABM0JK31_APLCA|nr:dye-decolorizing peroxidase YfeX [Aplysia californica]
MSVFSKARFLAPLLAGTKRQALSSGLKVNSSKTFGVGSGVCCMGIVCAGALYLKNQNEESSKSSFWPQGKLNSILKFAVPTVYGKGTREEFLTAPATPPIGKTVKNTSLCHDPCAAKKKPRKSCQVSQCNITSEAKCYSLFLWISINPSANPCCVARVAADIESAIDSVTEPCEDPSQEVVAGVGFGPNFYSQVMGKTCKNFYYSARKGANGELPSSSGDVFLHAKCNNKGKLFDLCKNYICSFPEGSICEFEDVYGFDYQNGRDLSGFLDNRTNRCDEEGLKDVAIECETGGSYALAQKWVHDFCIIRPENKPALEKYIGRDMDCGKELKCKGPSSHVARMTGTTEQNATPQYEIVRQSQNYGSLANDAGMFFLAFASDPAAFEFMLDQMVGAGCDNCCDDVMKISKNVKGTYWYFPSLRELCALVNSKQ